MKSATFCRSEDAQLASSVRGLQHDIADDIGA